MKKSTLIALFLLLWSQGQTQRVISLDSCVIWAKANYPLIKQNQLFN